MSGELLVEVYPNKGESKKDFVTRFMSVTKDEYPDIKQRYAICMSYWDRRNKKLKESEELVEGVSWLTCPECGSNNTDLVRRSKEFEKFDDYDAIENVFDLEFEAGTKEQDINKYQCNDCGHIFTKTDVDIKYSKIQK